MTSIAKKMLRAGTVVFLVSLSAIAVAEERVMQAEHKEFVGVWSTHYQTTFVYLIIHADRTANVIFLDQSYEVNETRWFPVKNGIIVGGFPMFRLWKGESPDTARAQMQEIPRDATNDTLGRFPLNFYMSKRQKTERLQVEVDDRNIPSGWLSDDPPANFRELAGVPRSPTPEN